jgi:hypothetical protein
MQSLKTLLGTNGCYRSYSESHYKGILLLRKARFPANWNYFRITRHLSPMSHVRKAVFRPRPRIWALAPI